MIIDVSTPLLHNIYAIIDDDDNWVLEGTKWGAQLFNGTIYIRRTVKGTHTQLLHRVIMKAEWYQIVDHKDRNTLINTKRNLRIATCKQNALNQGLSKRNKSGFKGVTLPRKGRYGAYCCGYRIGTFDSALEAAISYDNYVRFHFGEFAVTNKSLHLY